MTDAKPQSPEVGATKLGGDIAHAVVAPMPTPLLEPNLSGGNIKFIVDHQNFLRRNLMKPGQRGHGGTRAIHERLRTR